MPENHYNILGVPPNAASAAIKEAYQALAQRYHPDRCGDANRFAKVQAAYETLRDPVSREQYDRLLRSGEQESTSVTPHDGGGAGSSSALTVRLVQPKKSLLQLRKDALQSADDFVEKLLQPVKVENLREVLRDVTVRDELKGALNQVIDKAGDDDVVYSELIHPQSQLHPRHLYSARHYDESYMKLALCRIKVLGLISSSSCRFSSGFYMQLRERYSSEELQKNLSHQHHCELVSSQAVDSIGKGIASREEERVKQNIQKLCREWGVSLPADFFSNAPSRSQWYLALVRILFQQDKLLAFHKTPAVYTRLKVSAKYMVELLLGDRSVGSIDAWEFLCKVGSEVGKIKVCKKHFVRFLELNQGSTSTKFIDIIHVVVSQPPAVQVEGFIETLLDYPVIANVLPANSRLSEYLAAVQSLTLPQRQQDEDVARYLNTCFSINDIFGGDDTTYMNNMLLMKRLTNFSVLLQVLRLRSGAAFALALSVICTDYRHPTVTTTQQWQQMMEYCCAKHQAGMFQLLCMGCNLGVNLGEWYTLACKKSQYRKPIVSQVEHLLDVLVRHRPPQMNDPDYKLYLKESYDALENLFLTNRKLFDSKQVMVGLLTRGEHAPKVSDALLQGIVKSPYTFFKDDTGELFTFMLEYSEIAVACLRYLKTNPGSYAFSESSLNKILDAHKDCSDVMQAIADLLRSGYVPQGGEWTGKFLDELMRRGVQVIQAAFPDALMRKLADYQALKSRQSDQKLASTVEEAAFEPKAEPTMRYTVAYNNFQNGHIVAALRLYLVVVAETEQDIPLTFADICRIGRELKANKSDIKWNPENATTLYEVGILLAGWQYIDGASPNDQERRLTQPHAQSGMISETDALCYFEFITSQAPLDLLRHGGTQATIATTQSDDDLTAPRSVYAKAQYARATLLASREEAHPHEINALLIDMVDRLCSPAWALKYMREYDPITYAAEANSCEAEKAAWSEKLLIVALLDKLDDFFIQRVLLKHERVVTAKKVVGDNGQVEYHVTSSTSGDQLTEEALQQFCREEELIERRIPKNIKIIDSASLAAEGSGDDKRVQEKEKSQEILLALLNFFTEHNFPQARQCYADLLRYYPELFLQPGNKYIEEYLEANQQHGPAIVIKTVLDAIDKREVTCTLPERLSPEMQGLLLSLPEVQIRSAEQRLSWLQQLQEPSIIQNAGVDLVAGVDLAPCYQGLKQDAVIEAVLGGIDAQEEQGLLRKRLSSSMQELFDRLPPYSVCESFTPSSSLLGMQSQRSCWIRQLQEVGIQSELIDRQAQQARYDALWASRTCNEEMLDRLLPENGKARLHWLFAPSISHQGGCLLTHLLQAGHEQFTEEDIRVRYKLLMPLYNQLQFQEKQDTLGNSKLLMPLYNQLQFQEKQDTLGNSYTAMILFRALCGLYAKLTDPEQRKVVRDQIAKVCHADHGCADALLKCTRQHTNNIDDLRSDFDAAELASISCKHGMRHHCDDGDFSVRAHVIRLLAPKEASGESLLTANAIERCATFICSEKNVGYVLVYNIYFAFLSVSKRKAIVEKRWCQQLCNRILRLNKFASCADQVPVAFGQKDLRSMARQVLSQMPEVEVWAMLNDKLQAPSDNTEWLSEYAPHIVANIPFTGGATGSWNRERIEALSQYAVLPFSVKRSMLKNVSIPWYDRLCLRVAFYPKGVRRIVSTVRWISVMGALALVYLLGKYHLGGAICIGLYQYIQSLIQFPAATLSAQPIIGVIMVSAVLLMVTWLVINLCQNDTSVPVISDGKREPTKAESVMKAGKKGPEGGPLPSSLQAGHDDDGLAPLDEIVVASAGRGS